jgi:2-polyprenyl-6-methoxyphenol hydroxylase-like FAD-dependent oxidoreductase
MNNTVCIVGAGIGGLSIAALLVKGGVSSELNIVVKIL